MEILQAYTSKHAVIRTFKNEANMVLMRISFLHCIVQQVITLLHLDQDDIWERDKIEPECVV